MELHFAVNTTCFFLAFRGLHILEHGKPRLRPLMNGDVWEGITALQAWCLSAFVLSDRSLPFGGGLLLLFGNAAGCAEARLLHRTAYNQM
jgi:hypothetical protein